LFFKVLVYGVTKTQKQRKKTKLPKPIAEILKTGKVVVGRVGGRKLDFAPIVSKIIASTDAFTVKDVHEGKNLVNKRLSRQRVYKLLEKAYKDKKLFKLVDPNGEGHYFDYNKRRITK